MDREELAAACAVVMPFGKHKGETIARIGANEEGVLYLDWLLGEGIRSDSLRFAVTTFLACPAIAHQLAVRRNR